MVIKSLITNDLFFSERVFKNANLMELHFVSTAILADAISLRLQGKLSFPYNCQKMNGQIYVLLC